MKKDFVIPSFVDKCIELRFENNEICIYATPTGLRKLIGFCEELLRNPKQGHIHLEDYEVLTEASLKGVIAVFEEIKVGLET